MYVDVREVQELLRQNGFSDEKAHALTDATLMSAAEILKNTASSDDLNRLREELLRTQAERERDMTRTIYTAVFSGIAFLAALLTIFQFVA